MDADPVPSRARLLVVFPTGWDRKQLSACADRWRDEVDVVFAAPDDEECPAAFDVLGFLEGAVRGDLGPFDGVFSSSDDPGAPVAAAIATARGLPGPRPERVLHCAHKYYSRRAQQEVVPEATAAFCLVDPERPRLSGLGYPCWLKPVKGAFSRFSGRVESDAELRAFLARPALAEFRDGTLRMFHRLAERFARFEVDGRSFLAEALLEGRQVTVEGYAASGRVEVLGIVDSWMRPGTSSFVRFDFPSTLPEPVQARMAETARRLIAHLGLEQSPFNVEMVWQPGTDRVHVIEVNPRLCGQFADLYHKVLGLHGYEVALALALGRPPPPVRRGRFRHAASVPLRVFEPCRVRAAPSAGTIAAVEAEFDGVMVWNECRPGELLGDFDCEDGASRRYGVINLGADSPEELLETLARVRRRLDWRFGPP